MTLPAITPDARHARRTLVAIFIEKACCNKGRLGEGTTVDGTGTQAFLLEEFLPVLHSAKSVAASDCRLCTEHTETGQRFNCR